ncbi:hypothetical protein ABBQ38_006685 [Trebouxia sp. C0009 RCD-2024]
MQPGLRDASMKPSSSVKQALKASSTQSIKGKSGQLGHLGLPAHSCLLPAAPSCAQQRQVLQLSKVKDHLHLATWHCTGIAWKFGQNSVFFMNNLVMRCLCL